MSTRLITRSYGKLFCLLCAFSLMAGCASISSPEAPSTPETPQAVIPDDPSLIETLPEQVESFDYEGFKYFKKVEAGYTVRYTNKRKKRMADVYIYPVADENLKLGHSQLVMGSTRATLKAIGQAVSRGLYSNFNVIGAATHARGDRTIARVQTTYVRQNLASYSILYQTEHNGTLVKIRVTMPDNETNRQSGEWDRFALTMLDLVAKDLDAEVVHSTATTLSREAT